MTAPDTAAIRALKSKRSKCADVGNIDLSNVPESHETIWLQWGDNGGDDDTWCVDNINDDDVPYIRADLVFALCDEIERLTKAHDEALLAQVAAAYELAAQAKVFMAEEGGFLTRVPLLPETKAAIRALTPADAQAALEAYGLEKVREGMQRAAEVAADRCADCGAREVAGLVKAHILADMEKLK